MEINPVASEASPSSSKPEGVYLLRVVDQDLAIRGLRQILGVGTAADHLQKNSVLAVPKNWENLRHRFPPGAVAEDVSSIGDSLPVPADKIAILQNSLNNTTNQHITASGAGSIAAQHIHINVFGADSFKREDGVEEAAPLAAPSPHQPTENVDIKAALLALYKSESFKKINRLADPKKHVDISKSFIRLAVVLEQTFEKAQKKSLAGTDEKDSPRSKDIYLNSHEAIMRPKELVKVGKLFEHSDIDGLTPSRLLVMGAAGVGKSTLCQYLANAWAEHPEKLRGWKKFDYLFLIRLRDLVRNSESVPTLAEAIHKSVPSCSLESIESILSKNQENTLFLLDGYDEIAPWIGQEEGRIEFFRKLLSLPHWILTTRPNYFNEPQVSVNCRHLEIVGFTRKDTERYIDQFFKDSPVRKRARSLHRFVSSNLRIEALACIPINLELLCSVWEKKKEPSDKSYTMTKLYGEMSEFLFERYTNRKLGKEILGVTLSSREHSYLLELIETIAWKGLVIGSSLIIEEEIYKNLIPNDLEANKLLGGSKNNLHSVLFTDLGFFRPVHSAVNGQRPDLAEYYFVHLTFQEYFAARYFVRKFFQNDSQDEWKEFLKEQKFSPKLSVVFWFVAGLLCEKVHESKDSPKATREAKHALNAFIECLISEPRSLLRVQEIALAIHCLEEVEEVQISCRHKILDEFIAAIRAQISSGFRLFLRGTFSPILQGIHKFYFVEKKFMNALKNEGILEEVKEFAPFKVAGEDQNKVAEVLLDRVLKGRIGLSELSLDRVFKGRTTISELLDLKVEGEVLLKIIDALVLRLEGSELVACGAAAFALGRIGVREKSLEIKILKSLLQRLSKTDKGVRKPNSLEILFDNTEGTYIQKIVKALRERLTKTEFLEEQTINQFEQEILSILIRRLEDFDSDVVEGATKALSGLDLEGEQLKSATSALNRAFFRNSGDRKIRIAIVKTLGKLLFEKEVPDEVQETLMDGLFDEHTGVQLEVLSIFRTLLFEGGALEKRAHLLLYKLGDRNEEVCKIAKEIYFQFSEEMRREAIDTAIRNLATLPSDCTVAQIKVLKKTKSGGALSAEEIDKLDREGTKLFREGVLALSRLELEGEILGRAIRTLLLRLQDPNSEIREAAINGLKLFPIEGTLLQEVIGACFERSDDEGSEVSDWGARLIGKFRLENATINRLIKKIDDIDEACLHYILYALRGSFLQPEVLDRVVVALCQRLKETDWFAFDVVRSCFSAILFTKQHFDSLLEVFLIRLTDPREKVREQVVKTLAAIDWGEDSLERVVDALILRINDSIESVARNAIKALRRLLEERKIPDQLTRGLIGGLSDSREEVQRVVLKTMGTLRWDSEQKKKIFQIFLERMKDPDERTRRRGVQMIGGLGWEDSAVPNALIGGLHDKASSVRQEAADQLSGLELRGSVREEAIEALTQALRVSGEPIFLNVLGNYFPARNNMTEALLRMERNEEAQRKIGEVFLEIHGDSESKGLLNLLEMVKKFHLGGEVLEKVAKALIRRIKNQEEIGHEYAAYQLGKLALEGEIQRDAFEALLEASKDLNRTVVRQRAVRAFREFRLEEGQVDRVVEALVYLFRDPDHKICLDEISVLTKLKLNGKRAELTAVRLVESVGRFGARDLLEIAQALKSLELEKGELRSAVKALIQVFEGKNAKSATIFQRLMKLKGIMEFETLGKVMRAVAYELLGKKTFFYFHENALHFYSQGRISASIPMEEAEYRELEGLMSLSEERAH